MNKEELKEKIKEFLDNKDSLELELEVQPLKLFEELLEDLKFTLDSVENSGWEVYFNNYFKSNLDETKINLRGSLYYGHYNLVKGW